MQKARKMEPERLSFWCLGCKAVHQVSIATDGSGWRWNGSLESPTRSPSVFVNQPGPYYNPAVPICHSFVESGVIRYLTDCSHTLAGQDVELPDVSDGYCHLYEHDE